MHFPESSFLGSKKWSGPAVEEDMDPSKSQPGDDGPQSVDDEA